MQVHPQSRGRLILICLCLAGITAIVYAPALTNGFVNFDDHDYVTQSAQVSRGLSWNSVAWAFRGPHVANWHPLTTLSHMMDCHLFGLKPLGHHLGNVALHAANAVILFLLLHHMTGSLWRGSLVAAVFALHPAHVESVAWISERKDCLSTFFGLLTLLAYTRFTQSESSSGKIPRQPRKWYGITIAVFALSLMSKPMMVTLPCLMLLLDFWPLRRAPWNNWRQWRRCVVEKWPFFVLSAASSVITFVVQKNWGAMAEQFTLSERSANAVVSLIRYLGMTFWPVNLAAFYPLHPSSHLQIWGASLVLLLLTGLVLLQTRMRPYLLTGWLWFIGMLVPVLGLVQVGSQSMADRYLYLPQTGLMVALIWTAHSLWAGSRTGRWIMCLTASASLVAMIPLTVRQIRTWRSTETLFAHAVASTRNNARAHSILGYELAQNGKRDEGIAHLNESLRINPDIAEAHGKLGHVAEQGLNYEQAVAHYERAVALNQGLVEAHNNLAWIRSVHPDAALRNGAQAVRLAERACTLTRYERTICIGTLAAALAEAGRFEEAVQTAMRARSNALKWGEDDLARTNEQLMESYRAGKPFRDSRMLSK